MKYIPLLFFYFVAFSLIAQKTETTQTPGLYHQIPCRSSFDRVELEEKNTTETIQQFILKSIPTFKDVRSGLGFNYRHESLGGFHYSFTQTFTGVPVYQSEIKVNTDKRNTVLSVFDNSVISSTWQLKTETADENSIIVLHPRTGEPVLASLNTTNEFMERIEVGGEVIYERDTRMYFAAMDSLVSGKVFNPDPLTTAGQVYDTNTIYQHNNNANAPWLEAQLQTVNFRAEYDGIQFKLESPYVIISDFDTPNVAPVVSTLPQFYYSRPHTGLEDVMAFYHTNLFRSYVNGMGFNCANVRINMDSHAAYGADQSFYNRNHLPPRIYFGTGGVPDAQDADVIIHEYSHFLSDNASPLSNVGYERTSLDEGFSDYLAASYSRSLNRFNDSWVFSWDGHNEFWSGRFVNAYKFYPQHLSFNSIYRDGEIWSATLFQLNGDLGRGVIDSLAIESHYNYAQNISMKDAAQLLIIMDSSLNNGAHYCAIYKRLYERGLMPFRANPCGISSIGDSPDGSDAFRFTQDGNSFTVISNGAQAKGVEVEVYTLGGAKIISLPAVSYGSFPITYNNPLLSPGMYLVYLRSEGHASGAFKWVKTN